MTPNVGLRLVGLVAACVLTALAPLRADDSQLVVRRVARARDAALLAGDPQFLLESRADGAWIVRTGPDGLELLTRRGIATVTVVFDWPTELARLVPE